MSVDRPVEQFAFELVRRVLRVDVEEYDVSRRQGAVDALLHYPDHQQVAAFEVSSVGPEPEARITNALDGRSRRDIAGLQQTWWVQVPRNFHPSDLGGVDLALLNCEALGVRDLRQAAGDPLAEQLDGAGVRAWAAESVGTSNPAAWVLVEGIWGFIASGAADLPEELATVLQTERMQSKIAKLAATGLDERHLFLYVRPSAFSFPVFNVLAFGGPLPETPPQLPDGLAQIWLLIGLKTGGLVRAIGDRGWERTDIDIE